MRGLLEDAVLPLESVVLLVAGIAMLLAGSLLFPVIAGVLPYYENGLLGLLLFMYALQMITLGKTPFGDGSTCNPTDSGIACSVVYLYE